MAVQQPPNDRLAWRPRHDRVFETEDESAAEFDRRIGVPEPMVGNEPKHGERIHIPGGLFEYMYREVRGYYLTHRPHREEKTARIDRILIPGQRLRAAGWTTTIGVELKKSEADFGAAVSQAIDYTYCNWSVGDYWMYCERIFLWPFDMPGGPLQSVMIQNGIGTVHGRFYSEKYPTASPERDIKLDFRLERNNLAITPDDSIVECHPWNSGKKKGSR